MNCYKDITFCTAKNCGKLDCPLNTNRPDFQPEPTDRISWSGFSTCPEYRKLNYMENGK